eukprot:s1299_g14.t1
MLRCIWGCFLRLTIVQRSFRQLGSGNFTTYLLQKLGCPSRQQHAATLAPNSGDRVELDASATKDVAAEAETKPRSSERLRYTVLSRTARARLTTLGARMQRARTESSGRQRRV